MRGDFSFKGFNLFLKFLEFLLFLLSDGFFDLEEMSFGTSFEE
jgi:hypothetical protein